MSILSCLWEEYMCKVNKMVGVRLRIIDFIVKMT